jgi:hypothetical protein
MGIFSSLVDSHQHAVAWKLALNRASADRSWSQSLPGFISVVVVLVLAFAQLSLTALKLLYDHGGHSVICC